MRRQRVLRGAEPRDGWGTATNGVEVAVPAGQGCCGGLHLHAGIREEARKLARRNIDAGSERRFDAILTNTAGCGSTLKEYAVFLADDSSTQPAAGVRRQK